MRYKFQVTITAPDFETKKQLVQAWEAQCRGGFISNPEGDERDEKEIETEFAKIAENFEDRLFNALHSLETNRVVQEANATAKRNLEASFKTKPIEITKKGSVNKDANK